MTSWLFRMDNCFWRQMSPQMCISLCTLNYQSPFCKEYLSGPTAYNNAVQNNSYQLGKEKLFFPLRNVSTFTSIMSQYLALENKWICTMPIMSANSALYHIFRSAFSCTFCTWKKFLINKRKGNLFSCLKLLLWSLKVLFMKFI